MTDYIRRDDALKDFEACNAENPRWTPQRVKTLLLRQAAANVAIDRFPDVDAVIVTRCKDCRYLGRELDKGLYSCDNYCLPCCKLDSYCSYGERREGGNDNVSD